MTADAATGTESTNRRAALVYNPIKVDAERLRASVERESDAHGWGAPLFFETTVEDVGHGVTREALDQHPAVVLVAGGDGTVRAVSEAMTGSGVPLTIVPSGTGNLLARNLRLPLGDPDAMVRAAFDGDPQPIDVGFARLTRADGSTEEHAFVVMGGMGLDAAMIANTDDDLKKRAGWVAYVDGAAKSLVRAKPFSIMYQLQGRRMHRASVHAVLFANCGSLQGGLELIPEASVSDGLLDVALFQPKGAFGWLLVWRRLAWDNSVLRRFRAGREILRFRTKDDAIQYSRGGGIDVASSEAQPVELDGDAFGEARQVRVRVEPGSLLVTMPAGMRVPEPLPPTHREKERAGADS